MEHKASQEQTDRDQCTRTTRVEGVGSCGRSSHRIASSVCQAVSKSSTSERQVEVVVARLHHQHVCGGGHRLHLQWLEAPGLHRPRWRAGWSKTRLRPLRWRRLPRTSVCQGRSTGYRPPHKSSRPHDLACARVGRTACAWPLGFHVLLDRRLSQARFPAMLGREARAQEPHGYTG